MTRKEEIKQAADSMGLWQGGAAMFQLGAEWADEHPRKGMVDIEKVCTFLHGVRLDYYAEHNDELINDLRKALEE